MAESLCDTCLCNVLFPKCYNIPKCAFNLIDIPDNMHDFFCGYMHELFDFFIFFCKSLKAHDVGWSLSSSVDNLDIKK